MALKIKKLRNAPLLQQLGPGLITGAADDDPSGIATYSQAGAQYGFGMLWTMVLTYPLMAAVQAISARVGRVTGRGLAANMLKVFPRPVVLILVALLFVANAINIGADIAAMGEAAALVTGEPTLWYAVGLGLFSLLLQMFAPYHRYVKFLKWLTLALFAYVAVVFMVKLDWAKAAVAVVQPPLTLDKTSITLIVAIFGTTISPYLFFWQSSEEAEEVVDDPEAEPLIRRPSQARVELARIRLDTYVGMAFSNIIALAIILATAATLHQSGHTDIQSAAQAAQALKPIAGHYASLLFSLGIIGTGLLAVPVLAGSAAYAVSECFGWKWGLELKPEQAVGFYAIIALAMAIGVGLCFTSIDPIKALVWAAVVNGVISVPILVAMMVVSMRRDIMGAFTITRIQLVFGWGATALMAAAAVAMIVTSL